MEQFIEFSANHWELVLALVVVLALLVKTSFPGGAGGNSVDPGDATHLINRDDALVIDTRTASEYADGHIINAIHAPIDQIKSQLDKLSKHRDKPIIVACQSGSRSATACRELRKAGFEKVYNLKGGLLAWKNANLPLTRKK